MCLNYKKLLACLLTVVLILSATSVSAAAYGNRESMGKIVREENFSLATSYASSNIDWEKIREELKAELIECPKEVDISRFNIPHNQENYDKMGSIIFDETAELFHIESYAPYYNTNSLLYTRIVPKYKRTKAVYQKMLAEFRDNANLLLDGLIDNNNLSDVEKALLLHDRLGVWNQYDYDTYYYDGKNEEVFSAYGALVVRKSVCQGYAEAYQYMLDELDIKNELCVSDAMNHIWNIVYIDGIPYHVDVTHDDSGNREGFIKHTNFLVSTNGYRNNSEQHKENDYITTPQDDRFEDAPWRDSTAAFQLVDDIIYYIDNDTQTINTFDDGETTQLKSVESRWYISDTRYYTDNYACLSNNGKELLYSLNDGVYSYNPYTYEDKKLFSPASFKKAYTVLGFNFDNGYLVCNLANELGDINLGNKSYIGGYTTESMFYNVPKPVVTNEANGIKVTWEKLNGANKYYVYRSVYYGPNWSGWQYVKGTTGNTFTDTSITSGKRVRYKVRAIADTVSGEFSEPIMITRIPATKVTSANYSDGILVQWNKVNSATKYYVYKSTYSSGKWSSWKYVKGTTGYSYVDKSATAGQYVKYMVRTMGSTYSGAYATTSTHRRLTSPSGSTTNYSSYIKIQWNKVTGAQKYYVYKSVYSDGKWSSWKYFKGTTGLYVNDTTVKKGEKVKYRIHALDRTYTSGYSYSVEIKH